LKGVVSAISRNPRIIHAKFKVCENEKQILLKIKMKGAAAPPKLK
jgi:hypothetical protein